MKKILIIADGLSGHGGTEKVIRDFYDYFTDNYKIKILLLNHCLNEEWLCDTHFEYVSAELILEDVLKQSLEQYQPNLILTPNYFYLKVLKEYKQASIIFWDHMSYSYYHAQKPVFLENIYYADHYFAICTGIEHSLHDLGISQEKISLIYNPIEQQQELKRTTEKIKFIYVGRLFCYQQKRCMDILHAIKKIKKLNFTFEFYGDGQDRTELEQAVQQFGLQEKVKFLGWFDKPWQAITEASCLILPSQYEGLPLVLGEAISYGIPCLASDCKFGPKDIITESVNGSLFEVGDVEVLANKMQQFVANPKNFYNADKIKESIAYLYRENYFKNLEKILEHL
ncbi:glycosyltransferase [Acinetobacter sp. HY1485]|uniref:glycosyltransferase n=1 Tax=Acinetobacter sp. HY1485 TaxID=2970918 RepID=UPI0022B9940D|nr:glycosyltransferase [Acinetobacter sp. HY1485]